MTHDYDDAVRSITQAYWHTLLENDTAARARAAAQAEHMGFAPEAAETMVNQFSREPLKEWLAQQSGQ